MAENKLQPVVETNKILIYFSTICGEIQRYRVEFLPSVAKFPDINGRIVALD